MITIQIKTELIEWVQERLDIDADEAQNFAEEFAGMLYFSDGFEATDGPSTGSGRSRLKEAAPVMLAACEAIQEAFAKGEIKFTRKRQADSDPYHPANIKLAAAIAQARGEEAQDEG